MLASELKFYLFVFSYASLLLFGPFVEVFPQVINNTVVVMPVFLPKLVELLFLSFVDF